MWSKTIAGASAAALAGERSPICIGTLESINHDDTFDTLMSLFPQVQATRPRMSVAATRKLVIPHISPKLVFQAGDAVMVSRYDGDRERVLEIRRVLSVVVSDTHRVIVEGDIYCQIGTHQATGYSAVKLDKSRVFVLAERLLRKAILVPQAGHHCYFLLLDYMRPYPVTSSSSVFIPVYVEPNDMILVKGDHNDVWYGRVVGCDSIDKTKPIRVNFYIESPRHSNQFKRESRRIDEVHMNSVVGIAEGRWTNDFSKWIANN